MLKSIRKGNKKLLDRCLNAVSGVMASVSYPIAVPPDGLRKAGKVGGGNHSPPSGKLCCPNSYFSLESIRMPEEDK